MHVLDPTWAFPSPHITCVFPLEKAWFLPRAEVFFQNLPYFHPDCLENPGMSFEMYIQKMEYNLCSVAVQTLALTGAGGEHSGRSAAPCANVKALVDVSSFCLVPWD